MKRDCKKNFMMRICGRGLYKDFDGEEWWEGVVTRVYDDD